MAMHTDISQLLVDYFSDYTKLSYARGKTIIAGDQPPDGVYFLKRGLVKIVALSNRGSESTLSVIRTPAIFPAGWLMADVDNAYFYVAFTDVLAFRAPKDEVLGFVDTHPEVLRDMVVRLTRGVGGMLKQMERLMHGSAKCLLVNVLLTLDGRFGTEKDNAEVIPLSLTHPELAAMTGVARETVTRLLNEWRNRGIVEYDRKEIRLLDIKALEQMCYSA